jgi:hypothetical protein
MTRLATLLALTGLAIPANASASRWFYERQPVAQTVDVSSSGTLKLKLHAPGRRVSARCAVAGVEAVSAEVAEARTLDFTCSGEVTVTPTLPWASTLMPIRSDVWLVETSAELDVSRGGVDYGTFAGKLTPTIGDGDAQGPGGHDDLDNTLAFHSAGEKLSGPNGATLSFVGFYKLGTRGHGASAGAS